ncbi:hypothetical protein [uncultured Victivallis sp.]|uniref:hypothetical protein n=1 Tax=Victivallis sp. TaxID=2049020 RepID=UPI0025E4C36D|nr:hypothetical protein [uncultured Victivallis sp.]
MMKPRSTSPAKLLHRHFALFLFAAPMPAGEQFLIRALAREERHAEAQELFRRRHKYWELKQP